MSSARRISKVAASIPSVRAANLAHFRRGVAIFNVGYNRQPAHTGHDLEQQCEPLAGKIGRLQGQAGDVPARPGQTSDQAHADRIVHQCEDDGHCRRRLLSGERRVSAGDEDINL